MQLLLLTLQCCFVMVICGAYPAVCRRGGVLCWVLGCVVRRVVVVLCWRCNLCISVAFKIGSWNSAKGSMSWGVCGGCSISIYFFGLRIFLFHQTYISQQLCLNMPFSAFLYDMQNTTQCSDPSHKKKQKKKKTEHHTEVKR